MSDLGRTLDRAHAAVTRSETMLTAAGLTFGFACAAHHRFMRIGPVKEIGE